MNEKKLPSGSSVRYLYQPGELEGGRRRATDPIWSLKVYEIEKIVIKPNAPVIIICLTAQNAGLSVKSCWLSLLIHSYRQQSNYETRSALCEYRLPIPSVCRNKRSAPASDALSSRYLCENQCSLPCPCCHPTLT